MVLRRLQISHCPECHSQLMIVNGWGHMFGEYYCSKCDEYADYYAMRLRVEDKIRRVQNQRFYNEQKRKLLIS